LLLSNLIHLPLLDSKGDVEDSVEEVERLAEEVKEGVAVKEVGVKERAAEARAKAVKAREAVAKEKVAKARVVEVKVERVEERKEAMVRAILEVEAMDWEPLGGEVVKTVAKMRRSTYGRDTCIYNDCL